MRNKPPFPPCPPWFIFHFSLFQAPTCSLRTSPGGVWLVQGSRDCDGRAVPRRLAQPGSRSGCLWGSHTSRRDPAFQASELRGHGVHQGAALRRLSPTGMVGLLLICNAPHLTCALSQRPVPDLRKSCKVNAGVALPVKRDLEFPAQSRQCSASALKRSLEYLEIQCPVLGLCGYPPAALEEFAAAPSLRLPVASARSSCFLCLWRLFESPSVSRGGRYPGAAESLPSLSWTYHCCCGRACQITPTILASCPQNISWMLKSRGSINCRPSRGRGRQNWSRNAAGSSGSARMWRPAISCRRKPKSRCESCKKGLV
ncbi:uncharacterized protein LOC128853461 isoform X2 [Cuculus canorus]|uniref:uncharacterized protein LOC128853461 isoform X2 n=1 Tax=Cuculus canorus TaxID=55661 RepID=UPI0023AB05A0|nr:uncharacterized protein LOC128853461 isoform X2 [Cuculus canorus]XP_053934436.1 uncharacterized protein LOC128853461 isoform X2 [Cuculus canorus]XP_053934437.1 uncharacterized protein LOC128853461 isoform X2 [Cuculus canorus]